MAKEEEAKKPKTKGPMDYTELELAEMQADKKKSVLYKTIMKARRKIIREGKTDELLKVSGEELDIMRRKDPKGYKESVEILGEQKKQQLFVRLRSSTDYPIDTVRDWNMVIKAIERGIWHPTTPQLGAWRPPRRMSAYERFMNS